MSDRVNFLIVGAQRGGTTALHSYLSVHPDINMAREKEVHYFDAQKPKGDEWYHAHWDGDGLRGEATPSYMFMPAAPPRVKAYNPEMKLIFLLRHPVDRAYSHYLMDRERGRTAQGFAWLIRQEKRLLGGHRHYSYVMRGFYMHQIARWWAWFPVRQMLFLRSEEFLWDRAGTLDQVCSFLGVDRMPKLPHDQYVQSYPPLAGPMRNALLRRYADEVRQVEIFTAWNLDGWRR